MQVEWLNSLSIAVATAFLGRWGGGGFKWLPKPLNGGFKAARRYGIPILLWATGLHWALAGSICALLHLNMDAIEDREWWKVAAWGYSVACLTWPNQGILSLMAGTWWWFGTYWSNKGLQTFWSRHAPSHGGPRPIYKWADKLDWFWVELIFYGLLGVKIWTH